MLIYFSIATPNNDNIAFHRAYFKRVSVYLSEVSAHFVSQLIRLFNFQLLAFLCNLFHNYQYLKLLVHHIKTRM